MILTRPCLVNVVVIYEVIILLVSILVIGRVLVIATGFARIVSIGLLIGLILVGAVIGVLSPWSIIEVRFLTWTLIRRAWTLIRRAWSLIRAFIR